MRAPRQTRATTALTVIAAAMVLLSGLLFAPTAHAQTSSTTSPTAAEAFPARVELVAQDASTPLGGDVNLRFNVTNAPEGARLYFTILFSVRSRQAFDAAFIAGTPGNQSVLGFFNVPLDGVPTDDTGARALTLGLQSAALEADRLNIREPGVYPLKIELRSEDNRVLSKPFVTPLVVSQPDGNASVSERLRFVWVMPFSAPPSYLPNGESDPDVVAALQPSGRLGKQATALRNAFDIPVTVVPGPETMEAWTAAGRENAAVDAGVAAIRAAATVYQALGGAYVPVDIPSLLDHGLNSAVDEELGRGNQVFSAMIGVNPDSRTRLVRPASAPAIGRLLGDGINRVIVDSSAIATNEPRSTNPSTPSTPSTLVTPVRIGGVTPANDSVEALVTDGGLQGLLTANLPAALRAQILLAGLSVIASENPGAPRVITIASPDNFDAPPELHDALFKGLRNHPYLVPVTAGQAFDAVAPETAANGTPIVRELVATPSLEPLVSANSYNTQRNRLNSFGALTQPDDPAVGAADRSILASVSSAWPPDAGRTRAARHLATVDHAVDQFVALIEVPDTRTITLTSRSGEIPLTFRNETGATVRLRAALSSDKLTFPQGSVLELELPPKSSTWRVAVETRTSGTFPISLEVTSIDGVLPISQRRLEVRSTFVSTVGIVLMVSAVAFLAVWWVWDLRRRRRRKPQTVGRRSRTAES